MASRASGRSSPCDSSPCCAGIRTASSERDSARTDRRSPPSRKTAAGACGRPDRSPRSTRLAERRQHGVSARARADVLIVRRKGNTSGQRRLEHPTQARSCRCAAAASPSPDSAVWPCGRAAGCSPWSPDSRSRHGREPRRQRRRLECRDRRGAPDREGHRRRDRGCVQPGWPSPHRLLRGQAKGAGVALAEREARATRTGRELRRRLPVQRPVRTRLAPNPDRGQRVQRAARESGDGKGRRARQQRPTAQRGGRSQRTAVGRRHDGWQAPRLLRRRDSAAVARRRRTEP